MVLPLLAGDARAFITSLGPTLENPAVIARTLRPYPQQRLAGCGLRDSAVVVMSPLRR